MSLTDTCRRYATSDVIAVHTLDPFCPSGQGEVYLSARSEHYCLCAVA
jgi:hypothetical protein